MSSPLHDLIGLRLAEIRTSREMTVEDLALTSAVPAAEIARHEGGAPMTTDRLWAFAKALRVSMSAFFVNQLPPWRSASPTTPSVQEGLVLIKAFRAIDDAQLRQMLIDIADHFARRDEP